MRDLAFLAAENPKPKANVVYVASHTYFRADVMRKLRDWHSAKGHTLRAVTPEDYLTAAYESGFFGASTLFLDFSDFEKVKGDKWVTAADGLFQAIVAKELPNHLVCFVPDESPVRSAPTFGAFVKACTHIEETKLTDSAVPTLAEYFYTQAGLKYGELDNSTQFEAFLAEHVKNADEEFELGDLAQLIEFGALVFFDPATRRLDLTHFRQAYPPNEKSKHYELHERLFRFLTSPKLEQHTALSQWLTTQLSSGASERQLFGQLHRAFRDILAVNQHLNPTKAYPENWSKWRKEQLERYSGLGLKTSYLFLSLLFRHEIQFNTRPFLAAFDMFGREFIQRRLDTEE